jgi:GTP-binding protein
VPNLGIVSYRDNQSFVMADIPGIIEGASEGKGLGLRFLRHIERNSLLLFIIPADSDDIKTEFSILLNELTQYNPELADKKRLLAISKTDLLDDELMHAIAQELPDIPYVFISAVTTYGIAALKDMLWRELNSEEIQIGPTTEKDSLVHRNLDIKSVVFDEEEDTPDRPEEEDYDEEEDE